MNKDHKHQKMLYERFYGFALKVVFRYIYRFDRAVDVVNDGFVKVFVNFQKFEPGGGADTEKMLMGWIRRIMVNTAIDELRKSQLIPETGDLPEHIWEQADSGQRADQHLMYKELIEEVRKLPPSYRTVFNMHVIDGYAHQEIAATLGISVGTCKSNLSKAREYLKKVINKDIQQADVCSL